MLALARDQTPDCLRASTTVISAQLLPPWTTRRALKLGVNLLRRTSRTPDTASAKENMVGYIYC